MGLVLITGSNQEAAMKANLATISKAHGYEFDDEQITLVAQAFIAIEFPDKSEVDVEAFASSSLEVLSTYKDDFISTLATIQSWAVEMGGKII